MQIGFPVWKSQSGIVEALRFFVGPGSTKYDNGAPNAMLNMATGMNVY
jgi:hypothetical protein